MSTRIQNDFPTSRPHETTHHPETEGVASQSAGVRGSGGQELPPSGSGVTSADANKPLDLMEPSLEKLQGQQRIWSQQTRRRNRFPSVPVGEHELDGVKLADSPVSQHLVAALHNPPPEMKFEDLFVEESFAFDSAPDPASMMQAAHRANAERQLHGPTIKLRVKTYNVALLDVKLGPVQYQQSPEIHSRSPLLPEHIMSQGQEIIFLQEVWRDEELRVFEEAAPRFGYRAFHTSRGDYSDGLLTLIKEDMIAEGTIPKLDACAYDKQTWKERFGRGLIRGIFNKGIKRGFHRVSFEHPGLGAINVFNTHVAPYPGRWRMRLEHMRQLGIAVRATDPEGHKITFVGGDMNSGPAYPADEFRKPDGSIEDPWFENTFSYAAFQHYSGLSDLAVMGRSAEEADDDLEIGLKLYRGEISESPNPAWPNTATDRTNDLYQRQYGGTEFPARLDYVLGNTAGGRMKVLRAGATETEDIDSSHPYEYSDHYAMEIEAEIQAER